MSEVQKRDYNTEQRREMADKGQALPDGSFPIADKVDLGNALQSIGRASNREMALAHIRRRAKDLNAMEMLPDWAMEKAVSADAIVLEQLRPYADATDEQWDLIVEEVAKVGGIRYLNGYAAEVLRKSAAVIAATTTAAQMSGGKGKSFGGNRSAAGQYAARVRWGGRGQRSGGSQASNGKDDKPSMAVGSMSDQILGDIGSSVKGDLGNGGVDMRLDPKWHNSKKMFVGDLFGAQRQIEARTVVAAGELKRGAVIVFHNPNTRVASMGIVTVHKVERRGDSVTVTFQPASSSIQHWRSGPRLDIGEHPEGWKLKDKPNDQRTVTFHVNDIMDQLWLGPAEDYRSDGT